MFKTEKLISKAFLVGLSLMVLCSCGYQLVKDKGVYGGDISSINVPVFKNKTYEPHASLYVTDAFTRELISTGLFRINKADSDGYLEGSIKSIVINPSSMSKDGLVVEKSITLEVDLSLFRKNGAFIKKWALSENEIYRVDDINSEDYNKREAIRRLTSRIARKFTSIMLVDY